ncbi:unnamed protein product [Sphagnum jensenii]
MLNARRDYVIEVYIAEEQGMKQSPELAMALFNNRKELRAILSPPESEAAASPALPPARSTARFDSPGDNEFFVSVNTESAKESNESKHESKHETLVMKCNDDNVLDIDESLRCLSRILANLTNKYDPNTALMTG